MVQLNADPAFHYEILRALGLATYGGADAGEVLATADEIVPGDFESFYAGFNKRAEHISAQIEQMSNPISIRDASFRAATYYRQADLYVHGNWDDPRINDLWEKQTKCFDRAMSLLPIPGERKTISAPAGFQIPLILFPANANSEKPRPTIVMSSGLDGSMEEMYHVHGIAALQRGYNVVCYEGPGQLFTRRSQGLGFIVEWEKVLSPVIDYLETVPYIDSTKIGLIGYSLNGLLSTRAAAFEHRLAALFCIDGFYDVGQAPIVKTLGAFLHQKLPNPDAAALQAFINDPQNPTTLRWGLAHGMWAFKVQSPFELIEKLEQFTVAGLVDKIQCRVLVCDAEEDHLGKGQPKLLVDALGNKATHALFTKQDAAEQHCHLGAARHCNQVIYDWFEDEIVNK